MADDGVWDKENGCKCKCCQSEELEDAEHMLIDEIYYIVWQRWEGDDHHEELMSENLGAWCNGS